MLVGASGLVGSALLARALEDSRVTVVVAPTRRALTPHPKLLNPVVDFDNLPVDADWWQVDAAACALGTTIRQAGSRAAFTTVDHDYPLAVAKAVHRNGTRTFALTSASGANAGSPIFYSRTKGELERDLRSLGFDSLTLLRPGLLGGERAERRPLEQAGLRMVGALERLLPARYRVVPAEQVAHALLRAALAASPGVQVVESEAIPGFMPD
ncbi:MAG: NAD-dependent dehydratase [Oxalobacteraceae bacterium]|nr:MAG: NAD-dependent dehydratase [Oxalobacteraceae bacterium]